MLDSDYEYPRRIVVDDTDPRITYDAGTWDLNASSFNSFGTWGDPHDHTLKGTKSGYASFTFTFTGDYVRVVGARDNSKIPRPVNATTDPRLLPQWTCQLDGTPIVQNFNYYPDIRTTTNVPLCESTGYLPKKSHTLTVNVTVTDPNTQVFWLDSIEYAPLDSVNLPAKEVVRVESSDTRSCMYHNNTGQWTDWGPGQGNLTYYKGAAMTFKFNGTSVSLYGTLLPSEPPRRFAYASAEGYYTVDNGEPILFKIPGSKPFPSDPGNDTFWYNQLLFNASQLEGGREHEIVITYSGAQDDNQQLAQSLVVDHFSIFNDWVPGIEPIADQTGRSGRKPVGAIIGGVTGGVLSLVGIIGLALYLFKRQKRQVNGVPVHSMFLVSPYTKIPEEPRQSHEIIDGQRRAEDSGIRYSSVAAILPPIYTAE